MAISFNSIPADVRVPLLVSEFDPSQAQQGPALMSYRALLVGQKTADGTAAANSLHKVTSVAQVITLAGRGSMLHRMAVAWYASNKSTELWIGVLEDNAAGAIADGTITVVDDNLSITGADADGTLALYLGGVRVAVAVTADDTVDEIATAIAAAINANEDLPVTATALSAAVTVTYRHKGTVGNDFDIRANYRDGDEYPENISLTIVPMAGGTSNPVLTTLITALGDSWFHIWAHPYTDATSLAAIEAELASRFLPPRMIDGLAITSAAGSQSELEAIGITRNSPHSCIVPSPGDNPVTPPCEFAAETAALVAYYGQQDPARPLKTLAYTNALPPAEVDRFTVYARGYNGAGLLYNGVSTTVVSGETVRIERIITTYQTNDAGADDTAYLDANTMLNLMYQRWSWQVHMAKYSRHKLADDGTRFGPGQAIMTPLLGRAEAYRWFQGLETLGLVEGFDQFARDLIVERNATDRNRLDFLFPSDLVNQLNTVATKFQHRL